jgi:ABC-type transporter Mla subunit MlaD
MLRQQLEDKLNKINKTININTNLITDIENEYLYGKNNNDINKFLNNINIENKELNDEKDNIIKDIKNFGRVLRDRFNN